MVVPCDLQVLTACLKSFAHGERFLSAACTPLSRHNPRMQRMLP